MYRTGTGVKVKILELGSMYRILEMKSRANCVNCDFGPCIATGVKVHCSVTGVEVHNTGTVVDVLNIGIGIEVPTMETGT